MACQPDISQDASLLRRAGVLLSWLCQSCGQPGHALCSPLRSSLCNVTSYAASHTWSAEQNGSLRQPRLDERVPA